ncbi:hypothetical protein EDC94DRAFT_698779 [Helicostylum pulchrum]|uniref:Uncharacterized protein n=1 Tax=Helicostylum pulchrum TaxID=562976 RepID=A0ABP9YGU3_9FUNG|nr:hypothetical protein EDC94DRAFT_698779 [Helicostylum pulchrum]
MLRYQRSLLSLTARKNLNFIPVRFNSSVNNKLQLNNATTPTTVEKEKTLSKPNEPKPTEPFGLENKPEISFVPVINIPKTEFAHHSFFSLYRPLLGLSDENETPFFSNKLPKTEEEVEQEKLDLMLAVYMNNCSPFVEPSQLPPDTQGEDWKEEFLEAFNDAEKESEQTEYTITEEAELADMIEPNESRPLPIFHMPESADVLDYLTSIESNMKTEHAKLDAQDKIKESRIKKMQILDGARRNGNKPRFYTKNNRNIHQRLRRYQQRWLLK